MKIKGELLKKHRQNKGYSLRELASKSGISLSTLNKWETSNSSNPLPSKLTILANALDITMDDLLYPEEKDGVQNEELVQNQYKEFVLNSPKDYLKNVRNQLFKTSSNGKSGLEALIAFKQNEQELNLSYQEDDGVDNQIFKYIKEIYRCEENGVGTIFNALTFFEMFKDAKMNYGNITFDKSGSNIFEYHNLEELFEDHLDILELLNEIADLQYSLANLMPLPDLNTQSDSLSKIEFDTPDLLYKQIKNDNLNLYEWFNKNKERYVLDIFTKFKSPYIMIDDQVKLILDLNSQESIINYKEALIDIIAYIYQRATKLYSLKDRHQCSIIKKISTKYLYIDNHHQAPSSADMIARDYKSVIQLLRFFHFDIIDIDCGFSDDDKNALDVLRFMVDKNISVSEIKVHSDYVIGKSEIIQYIKDNKDKLIGD